ncbi:cohesin subunit SA-1-like protein [Labeo rohita]|uniref:Cohesin subunit SA n=1 Tax=Labeo rohita TaxID=84645 RepID=A0A498MRI4_LABRO|nr:cohesin subunit SA-1-like protein [Labeo rohita]
MDESELYSSEDEDVSLTGSDFEFQLKTSKRKLSSNQGAASPKRVRHPSVSGSSQSQTPEDSRHLGPHGTQTDGRVTACHLYEAVRSGRSALLPVIDDWLEEYRSDREAGLLELINFVVQCSGCKGVVTREMFSCLQNADIISHLTKEFNEDSVSYPLVSVGSQWRHFREGVCEFVSLLVRGCRNSLLYDDFLFSSFIALLTGLADSQVRAFRHTSTLIVSVAAEVNAQVLMTRRRCELEKNKPVEHRAIDRIEELEDCYRELLEHQEDLRSIMNGIFKGVFIHRYRDRVPEIRAVCMEEMGVWLRENPASFLNDEHLKYVGWMLHDKQAAVRLQCVLTLQKLYVEKDFISRLELFTSRFKERILCMILDKDSDVAVETVKLLLLIKQQTDDGLSEEECAAVYPLVFATHRGLACAAGGFLYHTLCSVLDGRSDKRSVSVLRLLAHFFIESEDKLESALIDIMMCAVRQAAEATPPSTRAQKKNLTAREKRLQAQERRRITNHFIPVLPQLLAKFSADVVKVSCLLRAPLYFQLEVYTTSGRLEKCLDLLLSQVCDIMLKHREECVLEACVRVLCTLCSDCYSFCGRAERAVSQLLDSTVEKFTSNLAEILQVELKRVMKALHSFCVVCQSCLSVAQSHIRNQAFVCLCDVLLVFRKPCEGDGSPLQRFSPDDSLKAEMASFIIDYVFADPDEDLAVVQQEDCAAGEEEGQEMKMAALLERRNQLAGYCKLIIYGVLELRAATDILKYYNKDGRDEELTEIRLLAKKLAMNFSINLRLIRKPLLVLHQDGIRFASRGLDEGDLTNLSFLEILSEFSFKLLQPERKQLSVLRKSVIRSRQQSSLFSQSIQSHLSTLSLGREDASEDEEEPEIEDYDNEDSELDITLPSTHGSASFLEDLFE